MGAKLSYSSDHRGLLQYRRDTLQTKLDAVYMDPCNPCRPIGEELELREFRAKYLREELEKVNQQLKEIEQYYSYH